MALNYYKMFLCLNETAVLQQDNMITNDIRAYQQNIHKQRRFFLNILISLKDTCTNWIGGWMIVKSRWLNDCKVSVAKWL